MQSTAIFYLMIFLSGLASLVYEVVWSRQLTLVFGVSIYAVSAVVAAYMAGLAAGSYYFGKKIDHMQNPLRLYALLEIGTALYAGAFLLFLPHFTGISTALIPATASQALKLGIRFLLAGSMLLFPTLLMGGTLPVLLKAFPARFARLGRSVASLYGINTLGAAAGALLSGFVTLQFLGNRGSIIAGM
ncbi:MAG: spermidine synthase, partial [Calditrichaeota bacterium]